MARIVFMGTPDYARRVLEGLDRRDHDVIVVTKPDSPTGRHRIRTPSPVASWAVQRSLEVWRPGSLADIKEALAAWRPDYILTAAFGWILRPWLLDLPRWGAYNLHASLLPRWRGANPIAWAIRAGDSVSGVTLMRMDAGIDTGPIVDQKVVPIGPDDTTEQLTQKLADVAAQLWNETMRIQGSGPFSHHPQPETGMTTAHKFGPHDDEVDWSLSASRIHAWVRSLTPEPKASVHWGDTRIKIWDTHVENRGMGKRPGQVELDREDWIVGCGQDSLRIRRVQPPGRRAMSPGAFVRGLRDTPKDWILR